MKKFFSIIIIISITLLIGDYFYSGWGKLNRFPGIKLCVIEVEKISLSLFQDFPETFKQVNKSDIRTVFQFAYYYRGGDIKKARPFYCTLKEDKILRINYPSNFIGRPGYPTQSFITFISSNKSNGNELKYKEVQLTQQEYDNLIKILEEIKSYNITANLNDVSSVCGGSYATIYYQNKFYSKDICESSKIDGEIIRNTELSDKINTFINKIRDLVDLYRYKM